ncbi:sensor histidine kinase [Pontiella agarivorans]|uniref:Histidine kinase n=1 Tax=Pontiella agarivorans TaxID=3038953 RepID=A0ABU5MUB8_9BACT|nr:histidine kinase [Pontiella agarivorans]MDZ8117566.1 histidine kinase [Pontiella agarivorans]
MISSPSRRSGLILILLSGILIPQSGTAFINSAVSATEHKIADIQNRLEHLPITSHSASPWTIGYHYLDFGKAELPVVIELTFAETKPVDLIALIPVTYINEQGHHKPAGFSKRFTLELLHADGTSERVADHRKSAYHLEGIEPQLFYPQETNRCTGLRYTAYELSINNRLRQLSRMIALNEILVFSGQQNIALNATVNAPDIFRFGKSWAPECLTDGFMFFSHLDQHEFQAESFFHAYAEELVLTVDLKTEKTIDEFRIWPIRFSIFIQPPTVDGTSFPRNIRLEKLISPDDSAPEIIYQSGPELPRPGSTPFEKRIGPVTGRYFRISLSEPLPDFRLSDVTRISLAEIELCSQGEVITRGLPLSVEVKNPSPSEQARNYIADPVYLTDGDSNDGHILPLRDWVELFRQRMILQRKLAALESQLDFARGQDKRRIQYLAIATLFLIIFLVLMIWLVRLIAQKRWMKIRDQIAEDLHDEVGANLSSIAQSTELITESLPDAPPRIKELLGDTLNTARITAAETRQFVRLLENRETAADLTEHIKNTALRILGERTCLFDIDETCFLNQLPPSAKWDLMFFIKETLNNIIKHSGATQVEIILKSAGPCPRLTISDNGCGISAAPVSLHHLENRAKRLHAELDVQTGKNIGTTVSLTLTRWKMT